MVSSSVASSDASSLSSIGTEYTSAIDGVSSWQGDSFDSLSSQSHSVVSSFINVVKSQLESFASACSSYESYKSYKEAYDTASGKYNAATGEEKDAYAAKMKELSKQMTTYKNEIMSALSGVSTKLEATSIPTKDLASGKVLSYGSSSGIVQSAIDWALAIAADDSHGYSQQTRWGNPNYDCSSLVISAYEAAGLNVKEAGAGYTGNMRSAFTQMGFEWIPGNPDVSTLQPGDVLLNEGNHTEMYIGDGMNVGAHADRDGVNGDSSGSEISVSDYYAFPWDGVLRYVGNDSANV